MSINAFKGFYRGKKVLVTGHSGFKGSWLCTWLKMLGADVLGYSLLPNTSPSMYDVCKVGENLISEFKDIRDQKSLSLAVESFKPEIVFHLAAQPLVRESYKNPKQTYETNVMGTLNLYEVCRRCQSVKVIICITTDKVYENKEWIYGYREGDALGGYDPYSSSKACVELLTSSYRRSFFDELGVKVVSARAGNVIGGGDWAKDRLVPDIIRSLTEEKIITIRNPGAIRPWQHVLEPLAGYLSLAQKIYSSTSISSFSYNFGPNDADTQDVETIVQAALSTWGKGSYEVDMGYQVHEAQLLKLDITKSKVELKWRPVYNYKTAISETIAWYKAYYQNLSEDMAEITKVQIDKYTQCAWQEGIDWALE